MLLDWNTNYWREISPWSHGFDLGVWLRIVFLWTNCWILCSLTSFCSEDCGLVYYVNCDLVWAFILFYEQPVKELSSFWFWHLAWFQVFTELLMFSCGLIGICSYLCPCFSFWSIWPAWICVISWVQLAGQPSIMPGTNFSIGLFTQTFWPIFFTPATLIGIADFYHFTPLSVTLTLTWGHKVSVKQNLLASFSCIHFDWSGWTF